MIYFSRWIIKEEFITNYIAKVWQFGKRFKMFIDQDSITINLRSSLRDIFQNDPFTRLIDISQAVISVQRQKLVVCLQIIDHWGHILTAMDSKAICKEILFPTQLRFLLFEEDEEAFFSFCRFNRYISL